MPSTGAAIPAAGAQSSRGHSIFVLVLFVLATFAVSSVGARFMPGEWYEGLNKPPWNPPNAVFAPVWTVLYLMMAVAGWLVWRASGFTRARWALIAYGVQLALNAAWSWIFFGLHQPGLALIEILVLWVAIVITIVLFWHHSKTAAALLKPYLVWVSFASFLTFTLWRLNP